MAGDTGARCSGRSTIEELGLALRDTPFEVDRDASGPDRVVFRVRGSEDGHPRYGLRPGEDGVAISTDGSGRVEVRDSSTGHHRLLSLFLLVRAPHLLLLMVLFRAAVRALGLRPRVSDALLSRIPTDSDVAALVRRAVGFGGWRDEEVRRAAEGEGARMARAGAAVADPGDLTDDEASRVASSAPASERAVADGLSSTFGAVGRRIARENAREVVGLGPTPLVGRRYEALLGRHSAAPRWDQLPLSVRARAIGRMASDAEARLSESCGSDVAAAVLEGIRALEGAPDGPGGTPIPIGPTLPRDVVGKACRALATGSIASAVATAYLATHPDADQSRLTDARVRPVLAAAPRRPSLDALVEAVREKALPGLQSDARDVADWLADVTARDDPAADLVGDHGVDGAAIRLASRSRGDWPDGAVAAIEAAGGLGSMAHGDFSAYGAAATALAARCPDELSAVARSYADALAERHPDLMRLPGRQSAAPSARRLAVCYLEEGVPGLACAGLGVPAAAIGPDHASRLRAVAAAARDSWPDPSADPARALSAAASDRCGRELLDACAEAEGKALSAQPDWAAIAASAAIPRRESRTDRSDPASLVIAASARPLHMAEARAERD